MTLNLSRRSLLQGVSLVTSGALAPSVFTVAKAADSSEKVWTGYSICDACNHVPMCGVRFEARGNVITRIDNWKENPNHILCSKGLSTLQRLYNPNRLLYPMKRTNPKGSKDPGWVRISWDEAYKTIASELLRVREKYGPEKTLFYCGDPKEPRPAVQRLARFYGSHHYATESSVSCRQGCAMAEELNFGSPNVGAPPSPETKVFLILATNVWAQPMGWWQKIIAAKERGCKIITIDSRRTKTAEIADIHLQPRIGTDVALAMAMIRIIIKENLYDKAFVEKWTHGFAELREYCERFTPEYAEQETGVPAKLIVEAARLWAKGPGSYTLTTQSLSHNSNGINNTRALLLLPIIMGYIDIPGGVPFNKGPKNLGNPSSGIHPDMKDGAWWNDKKRRLTRYDAKNVPLWNDMKDAVSPNLFPEWVEKGMIKAFAGFGFNVNIWPQPSEYRKAFEKLEFGFACDMFYRPDSHDVLDIILPAAMNFERHAPFGIYASSVAVRTPVKPLGEAKEDWRIALELGCLIDKPENFFDGDPEKALDWLLQKWNRRLEKAVADLPALTQFDAPKKAFRKYETGGLRKDGKPGFNTPSGKCEFFSERAAKFGYPGIPAYVSMMPLTKEFDLRFLNGARKPYITHSKTRSDQPYLLEIEDRLTIFMHPDDAEKRGIREGDTVEIRSPFGGPVEARVMVSILVPPGLIDGQYGWLGKQNTQQLVCRGHWDPMSGYPAYFEMPVSVTKKEA